MPMPTTRRGRFLLYKQRQRRRLKRVYSRARRYTGDPFTKNRSTSRPLGVFSFDKQAPRVYPRHFPHKAMPPFLWVLFGGVSPSFERWGVTGPFVPIPVPGGIFDSDNGAPVGYYDRRVKSIPRLHLIDRLPYRSPQGVLTPDRVYPYAAYPSGRPSFAFLQGWV